MRGGTLHQHLPDIASVTVDHGGGAANTATTHPVTVTPGSVAYDILGADIVPTNSFHHQAVDRVGTALRVTGRTRDGVVEIVEDPARSLLIGVQWHPETLNAAAHQRLFSTLTRASAAAV
jgi:putative glutamine amidotransferase